MLICCYRFVVVAVAVVAVVVVAVVIVVTVTALSYLLRLLFTNAGFR